MHDNILYLCSDTYLFSWVLMRIRHFIYLFAWHKYYTDYSKQNIIMHFYVLK